MFLKMNKRQDNGQPCLTPRPNLNHCDVKPPLQIVLYISV